MIYKLCFNISLLLFSFSPGKVRCSSYQIVGNAVVFNVTMATGSEINLKWYINNVFTFNTSYQAHGEYTESHMISSVGLVFVRVKASNPVSEVLYNLTFTNLYTINGITLIGDKVVKNENATVTLKMDNSAHLPQGNLSVSTDFGDSTQPYITSISSSDDNLKTTGLPITHTYSDEGNYSVQVQLNSPVDVKNFSTIVQVMEPISRIQVKYIMWSLS